MHGVSHNQRHVRDGALYRHGYYDYAKVMYNYCDGEYDDSPRWKKSANGCLQRTGVGRHDIQSNRHLTGSRNVKL